MRHHMTSALNPLFTMPINVTTKEKKHTQKIARSLSHKYAKSEKRGMYLLNLMRNRKKYRCHRRRQVKREKSSHLMSPGTSGHSPLSAGGHCTNMITNTNTKIQIQNMKIHPKYKIQSTLRKKLMAKAVLGKAFKATGVSVGCGTAEITTSMIFLPAEY